jgi:hypothetical protein
MIATFSTSSYGGSPFRLHFLKTLKNTTVTSHSRLNSEKCYQQTSIKKLPIMELVHGSKVYFWGQFCDMAKVVIIHRKILAKFGYRLMYESKFLKKISYLFYYTT